MSDLPEIRIADGDRDRMSERLRLAYAEGRITEVELEERLVAVFEAKTEQDLVAVAADLPAPVAPPPVEPAVAKVQRRIGPYMPFLFPAVICTIIYLMTIPGQYFWPMWVWLGCGIPAAVASFFGSEDD